jgi:hypothetical protein
VVELHSLLSASKEQFHGFPWPRQAQKDRWKLSSDLVYRNGFDQVEIHSLLGAAHYQDRDLVREKLIRLAAREAVQNPNTMKVTLAASSLQGTLQ